MINIAKIIERVAYVSKTEKAMITVEVTCYNGKPVVSVLSSDKLSARGRNIIERVMHINTKTVKRNWDPLNLLRKGSRTDKDGTEYTLTFLKTAVCKVVGTKKETREVTKIVKSEETVTIKETVNVPIYECPKGVTYT